MGIEEPLRQPLNHGVHLTKEVLAVDAVIFIERLKRLIRHGLFVLPFCGETLPFLFIRLHGRGFAQDELAQVTCPIGIPGIEGKEPEVIAVAVAAQLLQTLKGAS